MASLRQRMLEDMQVRRLSTCTQRTYVETVARFARYFDRSPARLGPEQIRAYQGVPDQRTSSRAQLAGRRRVGASLPLSGHAPEAVGLRRHDPRAEETAVPTGRAQSGRSGPVSRRGESREASRHPDHVLRRRPAHLRSRPPHRVRHRQRTHGAAHSEGQGTEGPLRDALAEAAGDPAHLVESPPGPATGSFPASARRRRSRRKPSGMPAGSPSDARASPKRFRHIRSGTLRHSATPSQEGRFPRGFVPGWDLSGAVGGHRGRLRFPLARRASRDPGG